MRLLKYHFAFIISNALLMLIVNRGVSGDWMFRLFLLTWLASVAFCVLALGFVSGRVFKSIRPVLKLALVYSCSFIVCNVFMASLDPNQVGWFNNLIRTYTDPGTLYLIVFPYAAGMFIACAWCAAGAKSKTPVVAPADKQLV
jgi:hypothetical protein